MSFYAVDYKDNKLGILDTSDNVVEYYSTDNIINFIKDGITIYGVLYTPEINSMYTINGLTVNLAYRRHKKVGKWIVVLLKQGDKWGTTLECSVKEDTLYFYDSSVKWDKHKYPFGQFVASYYLNTILQGNNSSSLCLDASIKSWFVTKEEMEEIIAWLWKIY